MDGKPDHPDEAMPVQAISGQGQILQKRGVLIEVNDLQWEKVVEKSDRPVAVMFYSPSCPYCKAIEPHFSQIAEEHKDTVTFARVNIAVNLWTAERFAVRGTPTFKFFCGGRPVFEVVGAIFPAVLRKVIGDVLVHGKECAARVTEVNYEVTGYG
jgi:thioredoxin-like negative regulator of GroEL